MNIALNAAAALSPHAIDDCGTPVPGHPPIPGLLGSLVSQLAETALNPQPLPPGEAGGHGGAIGAKASWEDGDLCPKPLPFPLPHSNILQQIAVQPEQLGVGAQQLQQQM